MKKLLTGSIKFYQEFISLFLKLGFPAGRCRYRPTCSEYTKRAIEKFGPLRGVGLGLKRIVKCNPFSVGGFDPIP